MRLGRATTFTAVLLLIAACGSPVEVKNGDVAATSEADNATTSSGVEQPPGPEAAHTLTGPQAATGSSSENSPQLSRPSDPNAVRIAEEDVADLAREVALARGASEESLASEDVYATLTPFSKVAEVLSDELPQIDPDHLVWVATIKAPVAVPSRPPTDDYQPPAATASRLTILVDAETGAVFGTLIGDDIARVNQDNELVKPSNDS